MTGKNNPFIDLLDALNSRAVFDLSEKAAECVQRTQETGKMSTLTFTLKFKPHGRGQVEVTDEIKASMPDYPRATTLMFATEDGTLVLDDPKQTTMNLRVVDTQPTNFKTVK